MQAEKGRVQPSQAARALGAFFASSCLGCRPPGGQGCRRRRMKRAVQLNRLIGPAGFAVFSTNEKLSFSLDFQAIE